MGQEVDVPELFTSGWRLSLSSQHRREAMDFQKRRLESEGSLSLAGGTGCDKAGPLLRTEFRRWLSGGAGTDCMVGVGSCDPSLLRVTGLR